MTRRVLDKLMAGPAAEIPLAVAAGANAVVVAGGDADLAALNGHPRAWHRSWETGEEARRSIQECVIFTREALRHGRHVYVTGHEPILVCAAFLAESGWDWEAALRWTKLRFPEGTVGQAAFDGWTGLYAASHLDRAVTVWEFLHLSTVAMVAP